ALAGPGRLAPKAARASLLPPLLLSPAILPAGPADRRRGETFARVPGVPGLPGVPRVPCERRREHRAGDRRRGGHRRSHRARTRAVAAHSSCSIVFVRTGRFARPTCRAVKSKGEEDGSAYIAEDCSGEGLCPSCGRPVGTSEMRYEYGTGCPSFFTSIAGAFEMKKDYFLIYPRTEYHCIRCGGHHGHLFDDGPPPTGQRWCNNGVALRFLPRQS